MTTDRGTRLGHRAGPISMTKAGWSLALGSQILLALGCHPNTTRPTFPPLPGAPFAELTLTVPRATGIVAGRHATGQSCRSPSSSRAMA
jgi:hypothetical protein